MVIIRTRNSAHSIPTYIYTCAIIEKANAKRSRIAIRVTAATNFDSLKNQDTTPLVKSQYDILVVSRLG